MSRNNEYTTGNLLDFVYFRKKYKLIATELNKQTKLKDKISYCNRSVLLVKFQLQVEQQCFSSLKNQKKLP